jgi:hypothetical protein
MEYGSIRLTVKRRPPEDRSSRQRRVCASRVLLPSEPITGAVAAFARSAAVFFGFLSSRFDLFCPFAMGTSNDAGVSRSSCWRRRPPYMKSGHIEFRTGLSGNVIKSVHVADGYFQCVHRQDSLMAAALAIISVAATAVIIAVFTVAAVVIAATAFAVAAIGLNDACRQPQQRTGKNNNQSQCHVSLHKVERIRFFDRAAIERRFWGR